MESEMFQGINNSGSPTRNFAMGVFGFMPGIVDQIGAMEEVVDDVAFMKILMVTTCFVGALGKDGTWVLVDTGLPDSADVIAEAAEERFGAGSRPEAIILTHGHFDHVGAVSELAERWKVPVYAHEKELPYLTGKANYLPPDLSVDDSVMAKLAPLYPHAALNLGSHINALPADGSLPGMVGWRWFHTPGHTDGHISLFRDSDRVLLAGDAFITVKQESWKSVRKLEALKPSVVVTGHGMPLRGEKISDEFQKLTRNFDELAILAKGRYVH